MLESLAYGAPTVLALLLASRMMRRSKEAKGPSTHIAGAADLFAVYLIAGGVVTGCAHGIEIGTDALWIAVFGAAALLAVTITARITGKLLAGGTLLLEADTGNLAATTAHAARVVALAILASNLFDGTSLDDLGVAIVFFLVALISLDTLVWCFRRLTTYDDTSAIREHNLAAALSHGGLEVAVAILVAHAADGPFVDYASSGRAYAIALAQGLLFWPLRQLLVECVLLGGRPTLRGGTLDRAIGDHADVGAGVLEAASYLATAMLVRSLG